MEAARERNRQMYEEYLEGATFTELAKRYEVSVTRARSLCKMEKVREEHLRHEVFRVLFILTDDEQMISKTITVLERLGATTIEEVLKLDRKVLMKTRNCGTVITELIMNAKEFFQENIEK